MKDIYGDEFYLKQYAPEVELVRCRLGDERWTHSLGVAHTARLLAEKYGADPAEAYLAGICHDIAKELPHGTRRLGRFCWLSCKRIILA